MPRTTGTFEAAASTVNPATAATDIDSADFNALIDDIESGLTESVYTAGLGASDNRIVRTDGTDTKKVQGSSVGLGDGGELLLPEIATPSTPASGYLALYAKSDGKAYQKNDGGTETDLSGGGSSLAVSGQVFTTSGTYTPSSGMTFCIIECIGGGGGGGGTANSGASTLTAGGGGGGGGYSSIIASAATIGASKAVTIGAAGAGGSAGNNNGSAGGDTSVGTICIAKGGSGGTGNDGATNGVAGGAGGVAGTGTVLITGQSGSIGNSGSAIIPSGGAGASALAFGFGPLNRVAGSFPSTGVAGSGYGSGGGSGQTYNAAGTAAGGAGTAGYVSITEFIQ